MVWTAWEELEILLSIHAYAVSALHNVGLRISNTDSVKIFSRCEFSFFTLSAVALSPSICYNL